MKQLFGINNTPDVWYSIVQGKENTSNPPTFFTKQEILSGDIEYKRAKEYGIEKAQEENFFLEKFRKTLWFELLVFCLNKKALASS